MNNGKFFVFNKETQTITDYDVENGGKDVRVPKKIEGIDVLHIGNMAFYNKGLINLVLPDSLLSIGEKAFGRNGIKSIAVNTDIALNRGFFELEVPLTWNVGNKSKNNKGYTQKEYQDILSNCGLDEYNLPDGISVEGSRGDWWIVDSRTTYESDGGYYNVKPIGFNDIHVYIVCPNCRLVHWHGAPKENRYDYLGFRTPHCTRDVEKKVEYNILKD